MAESNPQCQLRRRRSSGNPNLPLNLEVGFQVTDGAPSMDTPSPSCIRYAPNTREGSSSQAALNEFRKKQQSFDIQIEECEEEEIVLESDDEAEGEDMSMADRPVTPTPVQDFGANVVYKEGPQHTDFLKVNTLQSESVTDVSEGESDDEE